MCKIRSAVLQPTCGLRTAVLRPIAFAQESFFLEHCINDTFDTFFASYMKHGARHSLEVDFLFSGDNHFTVIKVVRIAAVTVSNSLILE